MSPERRLSQWCVNSLPGVLLQCQQAKYDKHPRLNNSTSEACYALLWAWLTNV